MVGVAGIAAAFFAPPWTQRRIERRREERRFRQARRLVGQELHRLSIELRATAGQNLGFPPELAGFLATPEWDEHRGVLAESLEEDVWRLVRDVYGNTKQLIPALALAPGAPLTPEQKGLILDIAERAQRARDALDAASAGRD